MQSLRQAPPPPPAARLPEDFQEMPRGTSWQLSSPQGREQQLLEDRKKEMAAELEDSLKQLDGERKEGLYRLDWELAEAIEALHAKHADRANKMISQHRETVSIMEKRAQAGEEMTADKVQTLRSPMREAPVQSAPISLRRDDSIEQDSDEDSESGSEGSESEEEGLFGRVNNLLGSIFRSDREEPPPRREPRTREYSQESSPPQMPALSPTDHWLGEGTYGSPETTNGYTPTSPMAMISGNLGLNSPLPELPDMPFPGGHIPFASGEPDCQSPVPIPVLEPLEWRSPNANGSRGSFGQLPRSPVWPPNNVYHGRGY